MIDVSDYDQFDYDYSTYWKDRNYENRAEKVLLNRILNNKRGKFFLDIGGSYGRLASTFNNQYTDPIILDYSLKTLQRNKEIIRSKYPNVELIAANAYKLPFKDNVFDGAMMVRVLHHIEKPKEYMKELKRVMNNDSSYIQEFANKVHIKAIVRALIKLNWSVFSKEPYHQPSMSSKEGSNEEQGGIFYNYHPKFVNEMLEESGFEVQKKYGCSFLRSPFIKKLINEDLMIFLEKVFQYTLSWTNISPSIFLDTKLTKKESEEEFNTLKDVLACPHCKGELDFSSSGIAKCKDCKKEYSMLDGIWDFRIK